MEGMKMKSKLLLGCLGVFLLATQALADIPTVINYQGCCTDKTTGAPLAGDSASVIFRLYTAAEGGSPVWTEPQTVTLKNGYFNVYLGSVTTFASAGLDFSVPYYLSVQVGTEVMSPRQQLCSVPYALYAQYADRVITPQVVSGAEDVTDYASGYFYVLLTATPREITLTLHLDNFSQANY
jgi:hypothetical protein